MHRTDKTPLDDNLSILVLRGEIFAERWRLLEENEDEDLANEQTADAPVLLLPEVYKLAEHVQK